jgi:hypothetical protein
MNAQKEQHPLAPNLGIEGCTIVTTFTTIIVPRKIAGEYFYLLSKFCQIRRKGSVDKYGRTGKAGSWNACRRCD